MSMSQSYTALRPEFKEALKEAAARFETPFYAYDWPSILERLGRLQSSFPQAEIFYAMKANPRLGLLRRLLERGIFVEAVSLGEVYRAYQAGFRRNEVLLNGPVKTPAMLEALSRMGIPILGLDSLADLKRVGKLLPRAQVLLRVNPDLTLWPTSSGLVSCCPGPRFFCGSTPICPSSPTTTWPQGGATANLACCPRTLGRPWNWHSKTSSRCWVCTSTWDRP